MNQPPQSPGVDKSQHRLNEDPSLTARPAYGLMLASTSVSVAVTNTSTEADMGEEASCSRSVSHSSFGGSH